TGALAGGVLTVTGSSAADTIVVHQTNNQISVTGVPGTFALNQVSRIDVRALDGDDVIDVRGVTVPLTLDGGAGADRFKLDLTSRATLPNFTATDKVEFSAPGRVVKSQVGPDGSLYVLTADGWLSVGGTRTYAQTADFAVAGNGTLYRLGIG